MTLASIYRMYHIPHSLEEHMLRVTSLAQIFITSWKSGGLNSSAIIQACALHDMANIIKFDLDNPTMFREIADRVDYWKKVQSEIIGKYGSNIHEATLAICKELNVSAEVLALVNDLDWDYTIKLLNQGNKDATLCIYCDMRIGPYGIMPLNERINNLKTRNKVLNYHILESVAAQLETDMQKQISINVNLVDNAQLNNRFAGLKNLDI